MGFRNVKAVFFDMGGVLMDVLPGYTREEALRFAISGPLVSQYLTDGFDLSSFLEFMASTIQRRSEETPDLQEDSYRIDKRDLEAFLGRKVPFEVHHEKFWRHVRFMTSHFVLNSNVKHTLEWIRARGYIIGLVSNVFHPGIVYKELFTRWDIIEFFNPLIFSSEYRFKKPNPAIFSYALSWHPHIKPNEAIFVGDTWDVDVRGSICAGLQPVWVNQDYDGTEREGIQVVKDVSEIIGLLS